MSKRRRVSLGKHQTLALPAKAGAGDDLTLPPSHAFVVQFRARAELERGCYVGRVEHVVSGRAELFHTLNELLDFLRRVVAIVRTESSADS